MPEPIGTVALGPDQRVVVALASGLAWFDPATERLECFLPIDVPTRLNDGRCDRQGRLWVGSMGPGGIQFRCTAEGATPVLRDIQVPNCTAFSPDGRHMYFADTPTKVIRRFNLNPATGDLTGEQAFAMLPPGCGSPDGATIDAEGGLWVAHWDGARVSRFLRDGTLERSVRVAAPRVTCCAFGGPDLATLFITTARSDGAPLSGSLFAVQPGVAGIPEARFGCGSF